MVALRILGVDPGLRCTGFGVIEVSQRGKDPEYVTSGTITTPFPAALPARIKVLHAGLTSVIEHYQPQVMAIEIVFVNVNPQATLLLGQARGALLAAAVMRDLEVHEYTALQVKQAVVGHGHASKEQVQAMVMRLLKLTELPRVDPADALACALRHAYGDLLPAVAAGRRSTRWRSVPGRTGNPS
ncbi:crossover junction endodeoxyribonuclease RuvC [Ferrovum myxofaciens]|jgi:crossover junction endodeoxyribonuclease RuvC|uniref:Crossover junction endodeoxyribonuclease RuvC n=2 Tax=root TaxID=1 RepID=A0A149VYG7_9PROT|nr:crossover junction endodeoxyribonuclease RuvC [Ferrovum myxofaciens]KXW58226.1 crossover junction endodeoxyribonuclease RuvC [Ferrovum myxofaciens]